MGPQWPAHVEPPRSAGTPGPDSPTRDVPGIPDPTRVQRIERRPVGSSRRPVTSSRTGGASPEPSSCRHPEIVLGSSARRTRSPGVADREVGSRSRGSNPRLGNRQEACAGLADAVSCRIATAPADVILSDRNSRGDVLSGRPLSRCRTASRPTVSIVVLGFGTPRRSAGDVKIRVSSAYLPCRPRQFAIVRQRTHIVRRFSHGEVDRRLSGLTTAVR